MYGGYAGCMGMLDIVRGQSRAFVRGASPFILFISQYQVISIIPSIEEFILYLIGVYLISQHEHLMSLL